MLPAAARRLGGAAPRGGRRRAGRCRTGRGRGRAGGARRRAGRRAAAGRRARVLELGCGLGAPSIVAARAGADVLATDGAPDAVAFAAHALALNERRRRGAARSTGRARRRARRARAVRPRAGRRRPLHARQRRSRAARCCRGCSRPAARSRHRRPGPHQRPRASSPPPRASFAAATAATRTATSTLYRLRPPLSSSSSPALVEHRHAEPLGLLELGARARRPRRRSRLLGHRAGDLAARGEDALGRLLAREVGQRAGEHERLARAAGPRRAAGPPPRSAGRPRRSSISARICGSCELARGSARRPSARCPASRRSAPAWRPAARRSCGSCCGEAAAGDVADALDPDREQHDAERPLPASASIAREQLVGARPRRSPRARAAARAVSR